MKNKIQILFSALFIGAFLVGCGWTDERKDKILGKCIEDRYDCDCYLKITMDRYPDPDDYNTKSEDDSEYKEKLEMECGKGWKDEEVVSLYEVCDTEKYDCDCGIEKIVDKYSNYSSFKNAIESDSKLMDDLMKDCKIGG